MNMEASSAVRFTESCTAVPSTSTILMTLRSSKNWVVMTGDARVWSATRRSGPLRSSRLKKSSDTEAANHDETHTGVHLWQKSLTAPACHTQICRPERRLREKRHLLFACDKVGECIN